MGDNPSTAAANNGASRRGARAALALLLAINLFNYIDRYVLAALVPQIRADLIAPDDPRGGLKMGSLFTAFMVSYMVLAPVFGRLGDRWPRWRVVALGVILWSLASGGSGLASAFLMLFLTRCLVGVGEAAYGPVAPTLIADLYPVAVRGRKLAWFYAAIPVGSALGYTLGGEVVKAGGPDAWRTAFYLVVPPGLLLGVLCLLMREPSRGEADPGARHTAARWRDYLVLARTPSYIYNTLGMTAMTFAFGGFAAWMPTYLVDDCGSPTLLGRDARSAFGAITAVAGLAATLAGGWAGDRLRARLPGSYFLVSGVGMIVGFPLAVAVLFTPFPANWAVIFVTVFCLFFNTGPTNTILANVTHPSVRASAFAINILIIHALGDVISPPIIGVLQDVTGSLRPGMVLVSVFILAGGLFWLCGARHLAEDTRLAPTRLADDSVTPAGASAPSPR